MSKCFLLGFVFLPIAGLGQKLPVPLAAKPKLVARHSAQQKLNVTMPCAVFYSPDDAWIARHKDADSTAFYTVAEDIMHYIAQAREYLRRRKIKAVDTRANTLRFVLANGSAKVFDLRNSTYGWGLVLFNGRTTPREADLVEPANDVKAVFGK